MNLKEGALFRRYNTCSKIISLFLLVVFGLNSCVVKNDVSTNEVNGVMNRVYENNAKGRPDLAISILDSMNYASAPGWHYFHILRYRFLAAHQNDLSQHDSCRMYTDSLISYLESNKLTEKFVVNYAEVLNNRGDLYYLNGRFDSAFQMYYRSRFLALQSNDTCNLGNQSYHLGMMSYKQEKFLEAANFFKNSYYETGRCANDSITYLKKQEILNNVALSYTRIKMKDSALLYYNKSLDYIAAQQKVYSFSKRLQRFSEVARAVVFGNQAKVYFEMDSVDLAIRLLLKSIDINSQPLNDNRDAIFSRMQLAEIYFKIGKTSELHDELAVIRTKLDSLPINNVEARWRHMMYQYHKQLNQPLIAFRYLEDYQQLKDSMETVVKSLRQTDYVELLKDQESKYQISLLRKNNELNRLYLAITVGIGLIAMAFLVLIMYNARKSRRNVKVLTALNEQVNKQKGNLEKALSELQKRTDDMDRILHVVAHDLRSPVGAILTLSGMMLEDEGDGPNKESFQMVVASCEGMLSLISELLEFSSDKNVLEEAHNEDIELNALAKQVCRLLRFKANEKGQTISLINTSNDVLVHARREKVTRVVNNLITNAIKFSFLGTTIKVIISADDKMASIQVKDEGIGIPAAVQPHIFDMFTSAKRHGTVGERSYGLGLSISKQIVEELGGRIWFESTEGKGSSFFVELPVVGI